MGYTSLPEMLLVLFMMDGLQVLNTSGLHTAQSNKRPKQCSVHVHPDRESRTCFKVNSAIVLRHDDANDVQVHNYSIFTTLVSNLPTRWTNPPWLACCLRRPGHPSSSGTQDAA